jgi:dihydropteroate synthase
MSELLTEMCWQGKRADMKAAELMELVTDWTGADVEDLADLPLEKANLVLDVLSAKLGKGKMPRKPRKKAKPKAKAKAKKKG